MKVKRIISLVAALCMVLSMAGAVILPATAAGEAVIITTADQLCAVAAGDMSASYELGADIDLSGKSFTPIGTVNAPFKGTFDGKHYKISGLKIEGAGSCVGLFGVNAGTVRNITLTEDCSISGSNYVGAIAGRNNGTIEDCISDATVTHTAASVLSNKTYKLLSQNLCQWGDNDLAASSSYVDSTTNSRRPSMLQRILNADPDLLCFQEVSFSNYNKHGKVITAWDTYLRNQLTDYTIYGTYRADNDTEGVTVGWKTAQFEQVDQGMFWLSENPDAPRSQQYRAWDAGCVRACTWVLLRDRNTNQHIAVYCTHYDHQGAVAQVKGAQVVTAKMDDKKAELLEEYPDTMFVMTGDFNVEPETESYKATDAGMGGWLDDARYAFEGAPIDDLTWGDNINSVTDEDNIIDYIFVDSATIQVTDFEILKDYYNNFRPSDHHGICAEFSKVENNGIGGICGSNGGTIQRVISRGSAEGAEAMGVGSLIGSNTGYAEAVYSTDAAGAIDHGRQSEILSLPEGEAALAVVVALNKHAKSGNFTFEEGEYVLVGDRDIRVPVCLTVNGEDLAVYPGDLYTPSDMGIEDPAYFLNGELIEGDSFIIPEGGGILNVADTVESVDNTVISGEYTVKSMRNWIYLWRNQDYFASREITIHLMTDLDFSTAASVQFTTMLNPAFSFDGHGYTVRNWGTPEAPIDQVGFFTVDSGAGGMNFIKDLNFEDCHLWDTVTSGGAGTTLVYAVVHGNAGMEGLPTEFRMENVHVKNCSLGATESEANAFLLSRYGVPNEKINVYLKNCSVEGSTLDANGHDHKGFLIGKIRSNAAGSQANFYMEDCIVAGNTLKNSNGFTGFAFGNIEATGVDAYLKNVAILNNTASGTKDGAIIGHMNRGGVVCEGVLMQGNTLNQSTRYVIASDENAPVNVTTSAIYCDNTDLTGVVDGKSNGLTGGADAIARGEAGYAINALLEAPAFWWSLDEEGGYITTTDRSKQIRKVTIRGVGETATYLNGGEIYTLPEGEYELIEGEATIENNQVVVNMDLIFAKEVAITDVTSAVSGGEYDITSLAEFIYLYNNRAFFRNRNIIIHLRCDLDLSDAAAADFHGFDDPYFSFDGHGNTIKNWGTEESPVMAKALFFAVNGGGLNYIKNLKLKNCHLTENIEDEYGDGNNALVYTSQQGNAGQAGLPASLTLEGITIKGCSLTTENEASALLLGRYAPESGNHTVNIKNIIVEDSLLDAGGMDHKGLLLGKPRSNNANGTAIFNLSDCYLFNNEITNAGDKNVGFVFGTAEMNRVSVNLNNIGIIGNKMTHSADGALIGYSDGGGVYANNMLIAGNEMTANKSYLLATKSGMGGVTLTDVYSDEESLTKSVEGGSQTHTVDAQKTASGEFNYTLNKKLSDPSFYWGMSEGLPAPATAANRTAKISVVDGELVAKDTFYADGGERITFTYEKAYYEILSTTGGEMEGDTLTMPQGGKDVILKVIENFCDHVYKIENAEPIEGNQHKIPCENECGIDKIEDCSLGDWAPEERQGIHYHARYCACGREEAEPCIYSEIAHLEGTDTHERSCPDCGNKALAENCTMIVSGAILPALGEQGEAETICSEGCGNKRTAQVLAGDVNGNDAVTIADVVLILRYLGNSLDATAHLGAGNVYTADGVAENFGLNTADAIAILQYLMN